MSQLQQGAINPPMSESMSESMPSNKSEIQWFIRRIKNYMIEDDEPLIEEFKELLEDPNVEDLTQENMQEYNEKVDEVIDICRVLDKFPMKKIEGYMRKKKLDNLNRLNEPQESMDKGVSIGPGDSI